MESGTRLHKKCVKAKHVVEDVANVWERGGLPHRLEDSRIVIALLDRVIRMKENPTPPPKKKFAMSVI